MAKESRQRRPRGAGGTQKKTIPGSTGKRRAAQTDMPDAPRSRPLIRPLVALALASPVFLYVEDPHKPQPKSRGIRETGEGTWIEIVDYTDPVTGRVVYSIEYGGADGADLPATAEWHDANGKTCRRDTFGYDSLGRLIRITERNPKGKLVRVTVYAIYQNGRVTTTVTDYTTSPATVTVYK